MAAEFGAAPRTVDDYIAIARARTRFAVDAATTTTDERAEAVSRLERLAKKLEEKGAWSRRSSTSSACSST